MKIVIINNFCFIFLIIIFYMISPIPQINGYTHWIVTENGIMIKPLSTSNFNLRQSWNLAKLIQQEKNIALMNSMDKTLEQVTEKLEKTQKIQNDIQKYYVDSNSACVKANKLISEFDLHSAHILTLEAKGIMSQSFIKEKRLKNLKNSHHDQSHYKQPYCETYFKKTFSMCCFDHLEAIRNRSQYLGVPEITLYKIAFPQHLTPIEYGHLITLELEEHHSNPSKNWIYYNMAAFYWRVKGVAKSAIECLRAALHTSPNYYSDIALVSLVNVLQLIKRAPRDAIILMENAASVSPHFTSHQIIIGNLYAGIGEFNKSLHHYRLAESLYKPSKDKIKFKDIEDRIFAVRCSLELNNAIEYQQTELDQHLTDIETVQSKTDVYDNAKISVELEKIPNETQLYFNQLYLSKIHIYNDLKYEKLNCTIYNQITKHYQYCDAVEERVLSIFLDTNNDLKTNLKRRYRVIPVRPYNPVESPLRLTNLINCRQMKFCWDTQHLNDYFSIFLSPINKGFNIKQFYKEISEKFQFNDKSNDDVLLHTCHAYINESELIPEHHKLIKNTEIRNNLQFIIKEKHILLLELSKHFPDDKYHKFSNINNYNYNGNIDYNKHLKLMSNLIDKGFRSNILPKWISLNMASLLWRIKGNQVQAIKCAKLAIQTTPYRFLDVSIVNLVVLLIQNHNINKNGDNDDFNDDNDKNNVQKNVILIIKNLLEKALEIDQNEPLIHLLLSFIYNLQSESDGDDSNNLKRSNYHLQISLNLESNLKVVSYHEDWIKCKLCQRYLNGEIDKERNKKLMLNRNRKLVNIFLKYGICESELSCPIRFDDLYSPSNQKLLSHLPHIKISLRGFPPNFMDPISNDDVLNDRNSIHKDDGDDDNNIRNKNNNSKNSINDNKNENSNDKQILDSSHNVLFGLLWNTDFPELTNQKLTNVPLNEPINAESIQAEKYSKIGLNRIKVSHSYPKFLSNNECIISNDSTRSTGCHSHKDLFEASENVIKFMDELRKFNTKTKKQSQSNNQKFSSKYPKKKTKSYNKSLQKGALDWNYFVKVKENDKYVLHDSIKNIETELMNSVENRVILNPLYPDDCDRIPPFNFKEYTPFYISLDSMGFKSSNILDTHNPMYSFNRELLPKCDPKLENILLQTILAYKVDFDLVKRANKPELDLSMNLLATFDDKYNTLEIGRRLHSGLYRNSTDWMLATIASTFWRVKGSALDALHCLETALENGPKQHQKLLLISASDIFYRLHQYPTALRLAYSALHCCRSFEKSKNYEQINQVAYFLIGNIFASQQQWQKAVYFYEAALFVKNDFEPAITRIRTIQCQQIIQQSLEINDRP